MPLKDHVKVVFPRSEGAERDRAVSEMTEISDEEFDKLMMRCVRYPGLISSREMPFTPEEYCKSKGMDIEAIKRGDLA